MVVRQCDSAKCGDRRGSILVMITVLVSSVALLSLVLVMTVSAASREVRQSREGVSTIYVCEAALSDAVFDLVNGGTGSLPTVAYGKGSYQVDAVPLGNGLTSLTATGSSGRYTSSIELVIRPTVASFFRWAAFGDERMTMDSNAHVDSYDSTVGTYASQETNGNGNSTYASDNGDVGSNADIALSSNASVHGDAQPGTASTVTITGNAFVTGSTAPALSPVQLPPISVPAIPISGSQTITGNVTIPSGSHGFDYLGLDSNATLTIIGPATLLVRNFSLLSNAQIIVDATNGGLELYVLEDFVIDSNTLIAATGYDPADVEIKLLGDNVIDPNTNVNLANVQFNSNAKIYGTIYAPKMAIDIDSNFELFGSIVARSVHLDSNSEIHFDENLMLGAGGGGGAYEAICWRILPNP